MSLEDKEITTEDENCIIFNFENENIVVDKISLQFLEGCTIEYVDSMIKSGFYIKENPIVEQSCSCGTSFTPNFDKIKTK